MLTLNFLVQKKSQSQENILNFLRICIEREPQNKQTKSQAEETETRQ